MKSNKKLREEHEKLLDEVIQAIAEHYWNIESTAEAVYFSKESLVWRKKLQDVRHYIQSTEGI